MGDDGTEVSSVRCTGFKPNAPRTACPKTPKCVCNVTTVRGPEITHMIASTTRSKSLYSCAMLDDPHFLQSAQCSPPCRSARHHLVWQPHLCAKAMLCPRAVPTNC